MLPEILHIYGPLAIRSYGLFICIGLILYIYCTQKLLVPRFINQDTYLSLLLLGIVTGVIGGRFLYILSHLNFFSSASDIIALWDGGFSILGCIASIIVSLVWYLKTHKLDTLGIMDRAVIFAPLLQSISRIGCFLSGCCWGIPSTSWFSISYTCDNVPCPIGISLHPTQLYSSLGLFVLFIIIVIYKEKFLKKPGTTLSFYLFLTATERFIVDFWRGEREFVEEGYWLVKTFSINQWVALGLMITALTTYLIIRHYRHESIWLHKA